MKPSHRATAVVGTGRLARALLVSLSGAPGRSLLVTGRTPARAAALSRKISGIRPVDDAEAAARRADLLLLAVPDREIEPLAARLSGVSGVSWKTKTVVHHAGALGLEPLRPLARQGASVGILHPFQALGDSPLAGSQLAGSYARIEGNRATRRVVTGLARDLGLTPFKGVRDLSARQRAAYHTAAALLSNDLVALLGMSTELLQSMGMPRRTALAALASLARGTLAQAEARGVSAALTGPVVRGDVETVRRHLECLRRLSRDDAATHALLSARLRRLADVEEGPLPSRTGRELRAALLEHIPSRNPHPRV